jgi:hypothetical protein
MPDRMLQDHNRVAALQHRPWHSVVMSFPANGQRDEPVASTRSSANPRRLPARFCWVGFVVGVLVGAGVLAAGCGGTSSGQAVASLGKTTTTTTASSAAPSGSKVRLNPRNTALAFAQCMRTHGEPNFPEAVFQRHSARITLHPGSGVDPNSPQYAAAYKACKHLLPNNGAPSQGQSITPAGQADYLKAAACMRKHGIPDFPDPTFRNGAVSFNSRTPIDTNASQYKYALAICQKLIPAGLPYSSSSSP